MSGISSKVKFLETTDSRVPAGQEKIQTGRDMGTTKRGAEFVGLIDVQEKIVVPTVPTGVAVPAPAFLLKHEMTNFFDRPGGTVIIQNLFYNMFENYGKGVFIHLYTANPNITSAVGATYVADEQAQKDYVGTIQCNAGSVQPIGVLNTKGAFTKDRQVKPIKAGATQSLWMAIVGADSHVAYTRADALYLKYITIQT